MTESLKERLRGRKLPTLEYRLLIDDPTEALKAVEWVESILRQIRIRDENKPPKDDEEQAARVVEKETTEAAASEAEAALDACYQIIVLQAMPPADYEELRADHPPTPEQAKDETVNTDTFRPALLAACAQGDMTVDDWAAFFAENASTGEGQALYVAALGVNESARLAHPSLGKGWMQTLG